MSGKPITGGGSLFGGLFGVPQSPEAKEEYLRRLKDAARVVAAWEAEARNESASNQKEKGWVN